MTFDILVLERRNSRESPYLGIFHQGRSQLAKPLDELHENDRGKSARGPQRDDDQPECHRNAPGADRLHGKKKRHVEKRHYHPGGPDSKKLKPNEGQGREKTHARKSQPIATKRVWERQHGDCRAFGSTQRLRLNSRLGPNRLEGTPCFQEPLLIREHQLDRLLPSVRISKPHPHKRSTPRTDGLCQLSHVADRNLILQIRAREQIEGWLERCNQSLSPEC